MIAPCDSIELPVRILSLGLNNDEHSIVNRYVGELGGVLINTKTDLEMWSQARSSHFDLCIVGQNEVIPNPIELVWLLKGITSQSRIIVVVSEINGYEHLQFNSSNQSNLLQRPIPPTKFIHSIDNALSKSEKPAHTWLTSITNIFHRSRKQKTTV